MERWGKTPMELGLEAEELDPVWHDAIARISAGYDREKQKQWDS